MTTIIREVSTKLNKNSSAVTTQLTLDFAGFTDEALFAPATSTIVIDWQAICRAAGKIPATDTIVVKEFLARSRSGGFKVTPESMAARIAKMSDEDYRATLVNMGLAEAVVNKMVKERTK